MWKENVCEMIVVMKQIRHTLLPPLPSSSVFLSLISVKGDAQVRFVFMKLPQRTFLSSFFLSYVILLLSKVRGVLSLCNGLYTPHHSSSFLPSVFLLLSNVKSNAHLLLLLLPLSPPSSPSSVTSRVMLEKYLSLWNSPHTYYLFLSPFRLSPQ